VTWLIFILCACVIGLVASVGESVNSTDDDDEEDSE
jgi:hypothetical protein